MWLGILLLPTACTPADDAGLIFSSDFEQFDGWTDTLPPFLNTERAYSGRYSYYVSDPGGFGQAYSTTLGAAPFISRTLRLSAQVYVPNGRIRSTKLVFTLLRHGRRPDVWQALPIDAVVRRYQLWEPVQKIIHLPSDLDPSDEIKVYLWHVESGGESIWLDDLKLEVLK